MLLLHAMLDAHHLNDMTASAEVMSYPNNPPTKTRSHIPCRRRSAVVACRKANNRESARRTRAKKTTRLTELEEENGQLRTQLQGVEQQLRELRALLQDLPQISQHQRSTPLRSVTLA